MRDEYFRSSAPTSQDHPSFRLPMNMDTPSNSTDTMSDYRMKIAYFGNELPNGDLVEILRSLWSHSKSRSHSLLAAFLDEATFILREEVRRLPQASSVQIPHFDSIISLGSNTELRKGPLKELIDSALFCIVQIGTFIGYISINLKINRRRGKANLA